jgi:Tol biopolymer transport system component
MPFFSPDSQWIGFVVNRALKRVPVAGGAVQTILEARVESLPSWGSRGSILFPDFSVPGQEGLFLVPASGGEPRQVSRLDRSAGEWEHFWPSFLPDGDHFFYVVSHAVPGRFALDHTVYVGSINSNVSKRVADVDSRMIYEPTGHVLYADAGTVMAQEFQLGTFQLLGNPVPIIDGVQHYEGTGMVEMSASSNGLLVIQESAQISELVWLDRTGKDLGVLGAGKQYGNVRQSPNGQRIAVEIVNRRSAATELFMFDRESGIPTQFTSDGNASSPVWSPDASTVYFRSGGPPDLYAKSADGRGGQRLLRALDGIETPLDVSNDGRLLVYSDASRSTNQDLWLLPLGNDTKPTPYMTTTAWETAARFSPDGDGWHSSRPSLAPARYMSRPLTIRERGIGSRQLEASLHGGGVTEKSCSTSRRTAISSPCHW